MAMTRLLRSFAIAGATIALGTRALMWKLGIIPSDKISITNYEEREE